MYRSERYRSYQGDWMQCNVVCFEGLGEGPFWQCIKTNLQSGWSVGLVVLLLQRVQRVTGGMVLLM